MFMNQFLLASSKEPNKMGNSLMLFKAVVELLTIFVLSPPNRRILGESYSKNVFNDSFIYKGPKGYGLLRLEHLSLLEASD